MSWVQGHGDKVLDRPVALVQGCSGTDPTLIYSSSNVCCWTLRKGLRNLGDVIAQVFKYEQLFSAHHVSLKLSVRSTLCPANSGCRAMLPLDRVDAHPDRSQSLKLPLAPQAAISVCITFQKFEIGKRPCAAHVESPGFHGLQC